MGPPGRRVAGRGLPGRLQPGGARVVRAQLWRADAGDRALRARLGGRESRRDGNPNVVPLAGDLAEALARTRAVDRAEHVLGWLQERADTTGLAYPQAAAARARGILAEDPTEAEAWFARAKAEYQRRPMPFEHARTLLGEGEVLRRARRPAAARGPLRQALTLFSSLGARPWLTRAKTELAATGIRADGGNGDSIHPGCPQPARTPGRPGRWAGT